MAGKDTTVCMVSARAEDLGGRVYNKKYTALGNCLADMLGSLSYDVNISRMLTNGMLGPNSVAFHVMSRLKDDVAACKDTRNDIFLPASNVFDTLPEKGVFGKEELKRHVDSADNCHVVCRDIPEKNRRTGTRVAVAVADRRMIDASDIALFVFEGFSKDEPEKKTHSKDMLRYAAKTGKLVIVAYMEDDGTFHGRVLPPDGKTVGAYYAQVCENVTCDF